MFIFPAWWTHLSKGRSIPKWWPSLRLWWTVKWCQRARTSNPVKIFLLKDWNKALCKKKLNNMNKKCTIVSVTVLYFGLRFVFRSETIIIWHFETYAWVKWEDWYLSHFCMTNMKLQPAVSLAKDEDWEKVTRLTRLCAKGTPICLLAPPKLPIFHVVFGLCVHTKTKA